MIELYNGDCLEVMKRLADNSVDSIVTDPPYELGFMGKSWDDTGIANNVDMWRECLRVLKPGGYLLSFSATRTYHRMASAIEDAGFEIRDMIEWVYGSGFPKSLNIGKAVDKLQGNERIKTGEIKHHAQKGVAVAEERDAIGGGAFGQAKDEEITKGTSEWEGWGTALKPAHEPICMARKPISEKTVAGNCLKWGTGGINIDESRVEGTQEYLDGKGNPTQKQSGDVYGFAKYDKLHTRAEPNTQGRFPANLIHDGSDEVVACFPDNKGAFAPVKSGQKGFGGVIYGKYETGGDDGKTFYGDGLGNASRFFKSILYYPKASKSERNKGCEGLEDRKISGMPDITMKIYADKAEREVLAKLFTEYLVKTDKEIADSYGFSPALIRMWRTGERIPNKETYYRLKSEFNIPNDLDYIYEIEQGERKSIIDSPTRKSANNHPTVKPEKLMEYLIEMVTPKNGTVLEPFLGSGTTGVAAVNLNRNFIGIELDKDYFSICEKRISDAQKQDLQTKLAI